MPLKRIGLEEYERRIKRLAFSDSAGNHVVKVNQVLASFEDDQEFSAQIQDETSILYKLITDPIFHVKQAQEAEELSPE